VDTAASPAWESPNIMDRSLIIDLAVDAVLPYHSAGDSCGYGGRIRGLVVLPMWLNESLSRP